MLIEQDPELLAGFLDEAEESLATVGRLFIELERDPAAGGTIEAIFRPVHSLKGNAAFFGLLSIKRVAHEMETVLDHVRKGRLAADRAVIDVLLAGLDLLIGLVGRVRGGGSDEDPAAIEPLSHRLGEQAARAAGAVDAVGDPEADLHAIEVALPAGDHPARAAVQRLRLRLKLAPKASAPPPPPGDPDRLQALLRKARTATLGEDEGREVQGALAALRDRAPDAAGRAAVQEAIDGVQVFVSAMGFEAAGAQYVEERLAQLPWAAGAPSAPAAPAPGASEGDRALEPHPDPRPAQPDTRKTSSDQHRRDSEAHENRGKSMRVAESTIDTFLHYVGELVVVGDMFRHLQTRVVATAGTQALGRDFRRANETFAGLSNQLQTSIMGIRKVSVKPLAQKVPRLVRDVALAIGKEIDCVIEGENVQVDKSLLDLLDAPLTHMVRNAVDHGIEKPEARVAAGKPRTGSVRVTFAETGNHITLTVADDGAGLNLDAIRRKAESLNLIPAGAALGEQDIVNMIFASGLSTAQQVTDISGRGVGMDVVKRAIDEAGGAINVSTQAGKGSTFSIRLPRGVTTQIVGGYLVRAGGTDYVLPLDRVHETFRCRPEDRRPLVDRTACVMRRDQVLPLGELGALLGGSPSRWPARGLPVVIVEARRRRIALAVEAVLGVQKVVIRRLAGLPPGAPMLSGAALLGDGHLALVLDLDQIQFGDAA